MIQRQKMGKEKKRKTLSQEFTLLTVVTSVGTLFLLGVVLISVFSFLFLQNAKEDMQYVLTVQTSRSKATSSLFQMAQFLSVIIHYWKHF